MLVKPFNFILFSTNVYLSWGERLLKLVKLIVSISSSSESKFVHTNSSSSFEQAKGITDKTEIE